MNLSAYKTGNTIKTFMFLAAMTALLLGIGFLIGGTGGLVVFLVLAVAMNFAMYWFSGPMALKMSRARQVDEGEEPELHRMVESLAQRAGVPKPGVYVIPQMQPNAFATGRSPEHAAIAVTEGIQRALPPRELEGVIAHEMAHIKNRDILISSIAAMIAGAISYAMWALLLFGGDDDNPIAAIGAFFLAPLAAGILQMAISRQREYVADTTGAELLGDPLPLADALGKLQIGANAVPMEVNQASAPLYIVNPLSSGKGRGRKMANLFSTHPPMEERIERLRRMAGQPSMALQTF
jgi:heat shock protein HtpX